MGTLGRKSADFWNSGSHGDSNMDFTSGNTAYNYNKNVQTLLLYGNCISFPYYALFLKLVSKLYPGNGFIPSHCVLDITEYNKAPLLLNMKWLLFTYLLW